MNVETECGGFVWSEREVFLPCRNRRKDNSKKTDVGGEGLCIN